MAIISWHNIYMLLAIEFDATLSDRANDINHLKEARLIIIDIISSNISPGDTAKFLRDIDLLYRQAQQHYSYNSWRDRMVKSINDYTVKHFGDLTAFVNNLSWPDGCVPFYWAELSENGHVDTSGWNICIS